MFWTIVSFFIAAMVLFALEILTPFFGVIIAMGFGFIIAAVWMTFTEFGDATGFTVMFTSIVLLPAYFILLIKVLPRSPLGRMLFLGKARDATGEAAPLSSQLESLIGKTGTAETTLHPCGAVRIDGRRVGARAESEMIEKNSTVSVVRAEGTEVIVRKISG